MKSNFTPSGNPQTFIIDGEPVTMNRKQRRRKLVDKKYTRHTRKLPVQHVDGSTPFKPKYPPHMTNNMRMKMREMNRSKAFEAENE